MMDLTMGPLLPSMIVPKTELPQADETSRFTMNDLIDFGDADPDAEHEEETNVDPHEASRRHLGMEHIDALEDYQAADSDNKSALDEATNAAILSLPKMMNSEA